MVAGVGVLGFVVVAALVAGRLALPASFLMAVPALFTLAAATGFGMLALRLCGAWRVLDAERWAWAAVVGLGVEGMCLWLLAHAHAFTRPAAAVVVAAGLVALASHGRSLVADLAGVDGAGRSSTWGALWLAALAPFGALVVLRAAAPPSFFDALVYHLGLPMQFAARGAAVVDVHDMFTAMPLLGEMAASPALLLGGPEGLGFVYALEWILLAAAVFTLARRVFPALPAAGGACAFATASMPLAVFLPSGTKPDLFAALLAVVVLRALAALATPRVVDVEGGVRVPLLRLGALCLGFGCATKTPFVLWTAVAVAVAVAVVLVDRRAAARRGVAGALAGRDGWRTLAVCLVLIVVAGALPYARNFVAFGDPLFPFAGGPAWAVHTRALLDADAHRPHGVLDVLSLPWTLMASTDPTADEVLGAVPFLGVAVLLVLRPAGTGRVFAVWGLAVALTLPLWLATHALPRYDPLLWVVLGVAGGAGLAAVRARAARAAVAAAVLLAGVVDFSWSFAADNVLLRDPNALLTQRVDRRAFLRGALEPFSAYTWLNEHHAGCVFLAGGDARVAYLEVPAVLSEVYARPFAAQIVAEAASVDDVVARIRETGATHVLLGNGAQRAWQRRGWGRFDAAAQARFDALPSALGAPVYEDRFEKVFAVPGPVPGPCTSGGR